MFQSTPFKTLTLVAFALTACAGSDARVDVSAPTTSEFSLTIGAGNLTLQRPESVTLHASVGGTASRLYTLTFASSDASVATVSSEGLLEAVGAGVATITATATLLDTGTTATASVEVSVIEPAQPPPAPDAGTTTSTTWRRCAIEHEHCAFTGTRTVRYGTDSVFVTRTLTDGTACDNAVFGDPAPTLLKACWVEETPEAPGPGPAPSTGVGPRITSFTGSGPIIAVAGQVISGVRISNPNGPCITISAGATNVTVRDSDIGPCAGDASIVVQGAGAVIEHNFVHEGRRGIYVTHTSNAAVRANKVHGPFAGNSCGTNNPSHCSSAIQFDAVQTGEADGNEIRGSNYGSDALSMFESSAMRVVNNDIDVNIAWQHAAPFTMGDSTTGRPGRDNYVGGNTVRQQGGVPPGVFGSEGSTILERNCLTSGIQAYDYSGVFVGVTVRDNVINLGASFVPVTSVIAGWSTNIDGTDCSRVPN